jgi:diguanylate cyclase (GGDEF)-like protein
MFDPAPSRTRIPLSPPLARVLRAPGARVAVSAEEVGARRLRESEWRHRSMHDPLTGLPNRTLFLDRLTQSLARARRSGRPLAVIFLDLDDFKLVNDRLGHAAGDLLLQGLAPRLASVLRVEDTLARFGGDEFVVLCEDLSGTAEALALADRLRDALAVPCRVGEHEHLVSCSMGVALSSPAYWGAPEALVRDADAAMYRAKAGGRDRFALFDDAMREDLLHRLEIEQGLRRALAEGELRLCVSGREALVHWEHPALGTLGPEAFLPIAEETGLIVAIGNWMIAEACRRAAQTPVVVAVSARQVADPGLVPAVADALERCGLRPDRLTLEVSETALVEDPDGAAEVLRALHSLGVGLAVVGPVVTMARALTATTLEAA